MPRTKKYQDSAESIIQDFSISSLSEIKEGDLYPADDTVYEEINGYKVTLPNISLNKTEDINLSSGPFPSDSTMCDISKSEIPKRNTTFKKPFPLNKKSRPRSSIFDFDRGDSELDSECDSETLKQKVQLPFQRKEKKSINTSLLNLESTDESLNCSKNVSNFVTRQSRKLKEKKDINKSLFDKALETSESDISTCTKPTFRLYKKKLKKINPEVFEDSFETSLNYSHVEKTGRQKLPFNKLRSTRQANSAMFDSDISESSLKINDNESNDKSNIENINNSSKNESIQKSCDIDNQSHDSKFKKSVTQKPFNKLRSRRQANSAIFDSDLSESSLAINDIESNNKSNIENINNSLNVKSNQKSCDIDNQLHGSKFKKSVNQKQCFNNIKNRQDHVTSAMFDSALISSEEETTFINSQNEDDSISDNTKSVIEEDCVNSLSTNEIIDQFENCNRSSNCRKVLFSKDKSTEELSEFVTSTTSEKEFQVEEIEGENDVEITNEDITDQNPSLELMGKTDVEVNFGNIHDIVEDCTKTLTIQEIINQSENINKASTPNKSHQESKQKSNDKSKESPPKITIIEKESQIEETEEENNINITNEDTTNIRHSSEKSKVNVEDLQESREHYQTNKEITDCNLESKMEDITVSNEEMINYNNIYENVALDQMLKEKNVTFEVENDKRDGLDYVDHCKSNGINKTSTLNSARKSIIKRVSTSQSNSKLILQCQNMETIPNVKYNHRDRDDSLRNLSFASKMPKQDLQNIASSELIEVIGKSSIHRKSQRISMSEVPSSPMPKRVSFMLNDNHQFRRKSTISDNSLYADKLSLSMSRPLSLNKSAYSLDSLVFEEGSENGSSGSAVLDLFASRSKSVTSGSNSNFEHSQLSRSSINSLNKEASSLNLSGSTNTENINKDMLETAESEDVEEQFLEVDQESEDTEEPSAKFEEQSEEDGQECDDEEQPEEVEQESEDVEELSDRFEEQSEEDGQECDDEECERFEEQPEEVEQESEDVEELSDRFEEQSEEVEQELDDVEEQSEEVEQELDDVEEQSERVDEHYETVEELSEEFKDQSQEIENQSEEVENQTEEVENQTEMIENQSVKVEEEIEAVVYPSKSILSDGNNINNINNNLKEVTILRELKKPYPKKPINKRKIQDIIENIPVSELKRKKRHLSKTLEKSNSTKSREQLLHEEIEEELLRNNRTKQDRFSKTGKLKKPRKWVTNKMYDFIIQKLQPTFGLKARVKAENVVLSLVEQTDNVMKKEKNYFEIVEEIKAELASLEIVHTHWDFYRFASQFFHGTFKDKVFPFGHGESTNPYEPSDPFESIL